MNTLAFTKMHGLGNSYIYIERQKNRHLSEKDLPGLAQAVACPNTGIGSDGLITIEPSSIASIKMRIFNKDGSEAKNCGNGLRCVAKYAFENNLVSSSKMTIETISGIVEAHVEDSHVSINMGAPRLCRQDLPMNGAPCDRIIAEPFSICGQKLQLTAISMGNPHAVFFVDTQHHNLHRTLGPQIEIDARFPEKTNVEFIWVENDHSLHMRVWERGSGVTQACGTGACAALVAAVLNGFCKKNETVTVHLEGGKLEIVWLDTGAIMMKGPAVTVATGVFCYS
ncbi:MAG: diaminopimelate epimerase [Parachlamydiaceae bacterium]|nr:diaminopimelate epimerase [Parachlamydiaceae bacterium]